MKELEKSNYRICRECNDMTCLEKTGMQGRLVRFLKEKPQLLSERIISKNGCVTTYEQYFKGHIYSGVDVSGYTGNESKVIKVVIKPNHVYNVKK
uniref:Uncharacterized protein n=1 Tax=viral metagenome TaxID=1070528 RepID=A0A6M3IGB6_9ZZZZ